MSATLLELRDQIIIDAGVIEDPLFPSTRLNRMINLAQRYVQTNLNGLGMKKWETSDSLTLADLAFVGYSTVTSNLSVDCPNMLESPNSIIFIETTSDTDVKGLAKEIDTKSFQEQLSNTYLIPTEVKPVFVRLNNKIYISPVTMASATAYYYKAVTDLSSDSGETEIPVEFEMFIVEKVVTEIKEILGKLQDKELAQKQLEADMREAYDKYKEKTKKINNVVLQ